MRRSPVTRLFTTLLFVTACIGWSQNNDRETAGRAARGRFDSARFRERMMQHVRDQLDATEQEWQVIQPLVDEVITRRREVNRSPGTGRRRRQDEPQQETTATLRTTIDNPASTPADLQAALQQFRASRRQQQAALEKAQDMLTRALTVRQEATLVLMGILE